MSRNEKKGTRRKAYSAQKVVRRWPPCPTGDDGLVSSLTQFAKMSIKKVIAENKCEKHKNYSLVFS